MKGYFVFVSSGEHLALGIGDTPEEAREDAMAALLALQWASEPEVIGGEE